ncbi:MAG: hypothetical protein GOU99_01655 [Candidatus Altiarchaeota archaeon]|nr:hypothetical protein [Candidatus Altiarchaeota archaeon]
MHDDYPVDENEEWEVKALVEGMEQADSGKKKRAVRPNELEVMEDWEEEF